MAKSIEDVVRDMEKDDVIPVDSSAAPAVKPDPDAEKVEALVARLVNPNKFGVSLQRNARQVGLTMAEAKRVRAAWRVRADAELAKAEPKPVEL